MKILLLGGNGYIGSRFYSCVSNIHEIESVDLCLFNKDNGYSNKINFYDYIKSRVISHFDAIICLAGHSSVSMADYNPNNSWINNVEYFRHLCDILEPKQKLIYASSGSVYGNSSKGLSTENSSINFDVLNNYDLQKITIDLIANKHIKNGKNIIGLRFGTVNGASLNTRADLMINSMVKSALETKKINVKNLHIHRAILGMRDLTHALYDIVDNEVKPGMYNLASFNSTVEEIANVVAKHTNAELVVHPNDKLAYDFQLDVSKFKENLNFKFKDTIESIINELVTMYDNLNFDTRDNDRNFKI